MQNRGTGPIQTPEEAAEEARLRAEAERLRGELEQITEKVTQIAGQSRNALADLIQENQDRLAFLQGQLAELQPLVSELEPVPSSPYAEVMAEKLQASIEVFEAGIRLVELQLGELTANFEAAQGEPNPEMTFADISETPAYLLGKAETDVAGARLKLADFTLPMGILEWYFAPTRKDVDDPLVQQIKACLDQDSKLKIEMNLALSTYKEAIELLTEGKKVVRGIRKFDWSLDLIHEFGDKVWGKLKGKLHQLDRLPDQVGETPLSAIFLKPEPSEPLPYQREHAWMTPVVHTPSSTGRLNQTGKLGQTGNLSGTGRLIDKNG
jgi:hypothetical protein